MTHNKAFLAFCLLASLANPAVGAAAESQCRGDIYSKDPKDTTPKGLDDPYYPAAKMLFGRMKGSCIDTSSQRPTRLLGPSEQKRFGGPVSGHIMIPNFHHAGLFWVARVPVGGVTEVIYQLDRWGLSAAEGVPMKGPNSGHGQLRFRFKEPVVLVPQVPSMSYPAKQVSVHDMIFSSEIAGARGQGWDIKDGMFGHLALVSLFTSHEGKAKYFMEQGHRVEQWRLNLTPQEGWKLFTNAIARSEEIGLHVKYSNIYRHCVSESLKILDKTFGKGVKPGYRVPSIASKPRDLRPSKVERSLKARRLIQKDGSSRIQDLNDEFPQWKK